MWVNSEFIKGNEIKLKVCSEEATSRSKPIDFVVVGCRKCATTWLYELLLRHDEVCVSSLVKQSGYFTKNFHKGAQWFYNLFDTCTNDIVLGEVDPEIITSPNGIMNIKEFSPEAKIIAIFRNPAELFYSSYQHSIRKGDLEDSPEGAWRNASQFREELQFGKMVHLIYKHFSKEQVLILLYEDIERDPVKFLNKIASFLQIKNKFADSIVNKRINPSRESKYAPLAKLSSRMARIFRRYGLHSVVNIAKNFASSNECVMNREKVNRDRNSELRTQIIEELSEELQEFQYLTGIDVGNWE